ncbi:CRTAC1 family protein [Flammeovirgaceae bacterium SG7u.111]|nr:CRTAC1 family protein [Flammeovirgaceae bacterium SG7u.132]WPO37732.1 CRTAC1 family protein [Flammeovirgaceae bacterium SG7u.111]
MPELLDKAAKEKFFVPDNVYAGSVRAAHFHALAEAATGTQKDRYLLREAESMLYAGKNQESIALLERLWANRNKGSMGSGLEFREIEEVRSLLALAYLRLGEQENCIHHHDASASCIIPIAPEGFHHAKEGSSKAVVFLEEFLSHNTHDLKARWLLNIAYMTLGEYPEGVPEKWAIPDSAFQSDYPLKKFEDIAPKLGLNVNELSGGGIVDDFNNDNLLDVFVSSWFPSHHLRYFTNNGDGSFTEQSETAALMETGGGLNMVQADYNNDGFLDVFVLRGAWMENLGEHPNSLLRNNGDNTFTDVTIEAGLLSFHPTQAAVWTDFNNDGWVDLFIGNESDTNNTHPCEFYINNGDGTFSEKTSEAGLLISTAQGPFFVKGATSLDYDKDGWMDLYVSTLQQENLFFKNRGVDEKGNVVFEEVGNNVGLGEKLSSFPIWSFDYNNDGWEDIFVAGYRRSYGSIIPDVASEYLGLPFRAETMRLYQNNRGTFTDVSKEVGLDKIGYAMGANFGDLDNDGYPDIYLSTGEVSFESIIPNRVFRNAAGEVFQDVTTAGGFGNIQKGHGVSFSDIDNDGDQDIHVVMGGAFEGDNFFNSLFENPYEEENNWVNLRLVGTKSNRSAIGSRIVVRVLEEGQERAFYHTVCSGGSFGSSTLRAEIGLGNTSEITQVEVVWAGSDTHQVFEGVQLNRFYTITEGKPQAEKLSLHALGL